MEEINKTLVQKLKLDLGFSDIFVESIRDGLLIANADGKIIMVNTALSELTGFQKNELLGAEAPFPFWPEELKKDFSNGFKKTLKEGLTGEHETLHIRKDGRRFPVSIFSSSIRDQEGNIIAHLGLLRDITDGKIDTFQNISVNQEVFSVLNYRRKYNDFIEEKELVSQLDFTLNSISDGIISLDRDWHYTYANGNAAAIVDRAPENLIGKHIWTEFPDIVETPFYNLALKAFETQQKQELEEYYAPFGKWFENRFYPSKEGLTIFFSDITERKRAEELLLVQKTGIVYHLRRVKLSHPRRTKVSIVGRMKVSH
ncbi:PAS domain-containing protein [Allomuricauda sp. CP2A]|uniref:PAS domain-containing protein n=1 Tax=Allomuricauda sp. CP2A TaxID=1848189 RepID=UPI000832807A|nr:PAS domain S-box protein [Muricauda sp. CP2A]